MGPTGAGAFQPFLQSAEGNHCSRTGKASGGSRCRPRTQLKKMTWRYRSVHQHGSISKSTANNETDPRRWIESPGSCTPPAAPRLMAPAPGNPKSEPAHDTPALGSANEES